MRRKVGLLFILCVVLTVTGCGGINSLKGTSWSIEMMGVETGFQFSDKKAEPYSMLNGSKVTEGTFDYTYKDNKLELSSEGVVVYKGTIKGEIMTLEIPFTNSTIDYKKK